MRLVDKYGGPIDSYIAEIIDTTTFRVETGGDADEEGATDMEDEMVSYYTGGDVTRLLFLGTSVLAVLTTLWHILYIVHPVVQGIRFRATHFVLMGVVIFLSTLSTDQDRRTRWAYNAFTLLMVAIILAAGAYVFLNFEAFWRRAGVPTNLDILVSTLLILVTLEGARRVVGPPFVILGVVTLGYGLFGQYIPGTLGHGGLSWQRIAAGAAVPNLTGIFGQFLDLSATLVTMFIFFGVFLLHLGGSDFFGDFALRVAGRLRSGPAQVAIVSSGFMGMLSGSSIANVAATGSFSIPLMKRLGYDKDFAGAIESVASTGGQITPPIMGATAFIMAEIIGTSYFNVIVAAAIPAFLYYVTLIVTAHLRAVKEDFQPVPRDEMVSLTSLVVRSYLFVPIVVIVLSLSEGDPAAVSAWKGLEAMIGLFVVYTLLVHREDLVAGVRAALGRLLMGADGASRSMGAIMIVIAELGWIIKVLTTTGVIGKLTSTLLLLSEGNLFVLLVMAAAIGIVLGFGTPSLVAYLVVGLLAAPAMVAFGVDVLAAHMFVFYFAILSAISPPVAGACLVACGISKGNFISTCKYAIRFALPAYLLPFLWVYDPSLILKGSLTGILTALLAVLVAIVLLASAFENILITEYTLPERAVAAIAAIALFVPMAQARGIGAALFAVLIIVQARRYIENGAYEFEVPGT